MCGGGGRYIKTLRCNHKPIKQLIDKPTNSQGANHLKTSSTLKKNQKKKDQEKLENQRKNQKSQEKSEKPRKIMKN